MQKRQKTSGRILAGTASWTDRGFVEHWYPPDLRASDRLRWYAEHFPLVEVNSTFYRVPDAKFVQSWADQTPPRFVFDLKLHRLLSRHSTKPEMLPLDLRGLGPMDKRRVEVTPKLERAVIRRFMEGIQPLKDENKLGALLLQLSPGFSPRSNKLEDLEVVLEFLSTEKLAIELRNNGWVNQERLNETLRFFKQNKLVFVMVDAPADSHFMVMPGQDVITNQQLAYLRAHGRNVSGYIRGRSVPERFDYDYSPEEISEIAKRAQQAAESAEEVHVVYNNNKDDYAPRAADAFQQFIKGAGHKIAKGKPIQEEFEHA